MKWETMEWYSSIRFFARRELWIPAQKTPKVYLSRTGLRA
jgi:hypothetical protein